MDRLRRFLNPKADPFRKEIEEILDDGIISEEMKGLIIDISDKAKKAGVDPDEIKKALGDKVEADNNERKSN
jgi:hypothetical protein